MNNRDPITAYLQATIDSAYECGKNKLLPEDEMIQKKCNTYSEIAKRLEPLAVAYHKNEKKLTKSFKLEQESYADYIHFQDHSDGRIACGWYNMYHDKSESLRQNQKQLEEKTSEILSTFKKT